MNSLRKRFKPAPVDELQKLERLWRRCALGWFATHWLLLSTNLCAAIVMLAGSRIGLSPEAELVASVYVPVSTLVIATLKPSMRATIFISAYRMLYFALLKQKIAAISTEKTISIAEEAEAMIAQGGYVPLFSETAQLEKR